LRKSNKRRSQQKPIPLFLPEWQTEVLFHADLTVGES
jgi:hypothetical protein